MSEGLRPDPPLTVSQWADQYRHLPQKASAEPGRWRTERTPYLREIMDCLSSTSPVREVVFVAGAQIGKTECGLNWIGYVIHIARGPMMAVQPTGEMAARNSRQRIDPLVTETEVLSRLVLPPRSRDSSNTIKAKDFPGGTLVMTGANSSPGLRSTPVKYLFADEIDAWPGDVDGEGDPLDLAEARTATFARRKIYKTSTPTLRNLSKIERAFEKTDKRYYFVPCPDCGEFQILKFAQLSWPKGKPKEVVYACEHCGVAIENYQKAWMLPRGQWRATAEDTSAGKVRGYHLSSLYSPVGWKSWQEIAEQWDDANHPQVDLKKLKVFINTVLGETWTVKGQAPEWQRLYERREKYKQGIVPRGGMVLTCGVDVQADRLELEIVAWGRGLESWSIDYIVLPGDTTSPGVWNKLAGHIGRMYPTDGGRDLAISMTAVDTGYNTQHVYAWVRRQGPGKVIAVKGEDHSTVPVGQPQAVDVQRGRKRMRRGLKVFPIAVGLFKSEFYGWLQLERPTEESGDPYPAGYCHHPQYDEEHFKQKTAEQLVPRERHGYEKHYWEKTRARNEALDCRIYARGAAAALRLDNYQPADWDRLESEIWPVENKKPEPPPRTPGGGGKLSVRSRFMER